MQISAYLKGCFVYWYEMFGVSFYGIEPEIMKKSCRTDQMQTRDS